MEVLYGAIKDIGAPVAAVLVQAILTWYKVRDLGRRMEKLEATVYGNGDGLASRVRVLEHDHERGDR